MASFYYKYQFKSDLPNNNYASYRGLIVYPNQEQRQGEYVLLNKKREVFLKARGNTQYKLDGKTNKWQVLPRDEDADLVVTIERVTANTKFYLIEQDSNYLTYSFHPNLSFLDPTFTRRIKAKLIIDRKSFLPVQLLAKDTLGKISWQVDFSEFDKQHRIQFPYLPNTQINLGAHKILAKNEINSVIAVLSKRLESAGENFDMKAKQDKGRTLFELNLEILGQNHDFKILRQLLLSKGRIYVMPLNESLAIANNSNIRDIKIISFKPYPQIEIVFDDEAREKINVFLGDCIGQAGFRVMLDSLEVAMFNLDKTDFSDRIIFRVLFNRNEIMNIIAIYKGGLLPLPLELIEIKSKR